MLQSGFQRRNGEMTKTGESGRFLATYAVCPGCGRRHPLATDLYACNCAQQENLSVCYDIGPGLRDNLLKSIARNENSLWRYAPLLPIECRFCTPLYVGWTPLYDFGHYGEARFFIKDETRNPSASLKDRASEIVIAVAAAHEIRSLIVASTGNAAASLACLGAAAGVQVTVLVPRNAPDAKLAQVVAYGASVYRIDGSYDDAYELARKVSAAKGILNRSTGLSPFTREGKKTCAFEIAEQLGWQAPDWVIVPTGDGNILSAIWKGFRELRELDMIETLPRLVAAQATASDAIARAFDPARSKGAGAAPEQTIADSITVGWPRDRTAALAALSESEGIAVAVGDDEIVLAVQNLAARFGVFVEPSSAAGFAVLERLLEDGVVGAGQRVVFLATGSGLKDLRPVLNPSALESVRLIGRDAWQNI
jgi:threonine synthase